MFDLGHVGRSAPGKGHAVTDPGVYTGPTLDLDFTIGVLDPRITFTRAITGPATYYDSNGVLRIAANNLCTNSSLLTNVIGVNASKTANVTTAPDGTLTGVQLTEDASAAVEHYMDYTFTPAGSTQYVFSFYVKQGTRRYAIAELRGAVNWAGGANAIAYIDLQNGVILSTTGGTSGMSNVGGGWYRVWISSTTIPSPAAVPLRLALSADGVANAYNGDGVSYAYFWGIQMEVGSTPTQYVATGAAANGAPRFDYDPVTHAARGLLIEETRTNVLFPSQTISLWPSHTDMTVTDNATTSPDGTVDASSVLSGVANTDSLSCTSITVAAGSTMTYSFFAKQGNFNSLHLFAVDTTGAANGMQGWIDLTTGAVTNTSVFGTATFSGATAANVGNGWWRVSVTVVMPGTSTTAVLMLRSASAAGSGTRVNNGLFYVWGAQIEVNAFPLSYIPTVGAAATRPGEIASMPVGVWWNQAAGAYYTEHMTAQGAAAGTQEGIVRVDDGTSNNYFTHFISSTNNITSFASIVTVTQINTPAANLLNVPNKVATAYGGGQNWRLSANGGGVVTGTNNAVAASETNVRLGSSSLTPPTWSLNGYLRRFTYYPGIISSAQLQQFVR